MSNTSEFETDLEPFLAPIDQREKRQLQSEVVRRLIAYFRATYEVFHVEHPSSHCPIVVWMTKDTLFPSNVFQGPIPLLFEAPSEYVEYDYREFNDERGGVRFLSTKKVNPKLDQTLQLSHEELISLVHTIDARMALLLDREKIILITHELAQWEKAVGYDQSVLVAESVRHDNAEALYRLGQLYFQFLGE